MNASLKEQLHVSAMHVQPLGDIDKAITSGVLRRNRTFAVVTAVGMTCVVILVAVFFGGGLGGSQPEPLQSPNPSPSADVRVWGWPDTSRNAPGLYSLDSDRCGAGGPGGYCSFAFMHNGYGSGDVDIYIDVDREGSAADVDPEDGAHVVVAGHDGTYRRVSDRHQQWIANIEGTTIAINLKAKPDTSQAEITEAVEIINSMYTEPRDNDLGFRLVFTITTNDWDSG